MIFNLLKRGSLPKLSYPITRDYPGRYFHLIVYTVAIFAVILLGAVAFATQGYEAKSVLSSTFNQTEFHWYNHFVSPQKSGELCDPHVFSIGEMFQTTQAIFPWIIDWTQLTPSNVDGAAVQGGVSYADSPLGIDSCDVSRMKVTVDLTSWTATISASVRCDDAFPVSASTSWTASTIPDRATWNSERYCAPIDPSDPESSNFLYASTILQPAGLDLLMALRHNMDPVETGNVITIAAKIDDVEGKLDCSPKPLHPILSTLGFSNFTFTNNTVAVDTFNALFYNATSNYMQAMLAAVRLDFGNMCPNFLSDLSHIEQTFIETPTLTPETYLRYFRSTESLSQSFYSFITKGEAFSFMESNLNWITLPLNATDAVYITAPYLCHLTIRKGAAQLVVSVTVAMSSLFLSGWSMFQFFAPWVVTYNSPKANHCIGHVKSDLEASSCSDDEMKSDPEPSLPAAGKTWGMDARSLLKFPPAAYLTSDSGKSHGSTVASTLMVDTSDFQKEEKYHLGQDFSAIMMDRTLSPCGSIKSANEEEGRPKHPNAVEATTPAPITLNVEEGAQRNASYGDGHSRKHSGIEPNGGVGPSSSPQTQNVATDPRGQYPGHAHTASNGGGGLPSAQDSEPSSYSGTHSHLQGVYCSPGSDGTPVILDQRYRQESNGGPHVPHAIGIREERTRDSDEPDGRWNGASLSHVRNLAFPSGSITSAA